MTDKIEEQNNTDKKAVVENSSDKAHTDKKEPSPRQNNATAAESPKKGSSFISYVAIMVSLGAIGLSGWQFYQDILQQSNTASLANLETSQKHLSKQFAAQQNAFASVQPELKQITAQISANITPKLNELDTINQDNNTRFTFDINVIKQKLNRLENTTKEDWKLAEAEYLIRLANQRLLMEKDIVGASKMLTNADDILAQLDDPLLFNARRTLAADIQSLNATTSFDLEGIYLQLEALISQVSNLPQKGHQRRKVSSQESPNSTALNQEDDTQPVAEKSLVDELWVTLKSLVIINHHNKPIKPLLPPTEYQQLVLNIQLQINVAQLALLKQEDAIYQTALLHIVQITNEHFDNQTNTVQSFLAAVTNLQNTNISPDLPLPRNSLVAIKDISKIWHSSLATKENGVNNISNTDTGTK